MLIQLTALLKQKKDLIRVVELSPHLKLVEIHQKFQDRSVEETESPIIENVTVLYHSQGLSTG